VLINQSADSKVEDAKNGVRAKERVTSGCGVVSLAGLIMIIAKNITQLTVNQDIKPVGTMAAVNRQ
jgi:hypothetical protein